MTDWLSDEDIISEMFKSEELENQDPVISKVPLLKHSRNKLIPEIIRKMGAMELDEDGQSLFESANEWLETRSSGVFCGKGSVKGGGF